MQNQRKRCSLGSLCIHSYDTFALPSLTWKQMEPRGVHALILTPSLRFVSAFSLRPCVGRKPWRERRWGQDKTKVREEEEEGAGGGGGKYAIKQHPYSDDVKSLHAQQRGSLDFTGFRLTCAHYCAAVTKTDTFMRIIKSFKRSCFLVIGSAFSLHRVLKRRGIKHKHGFKARRREKRRSWNMMCASAAAAKHTKRKKMTSSSLAFKINSLKYVRVLGDSRERTAAWTWAVRGWTGTHWTNALEN